MASNTERDIKKVGASQDVTEQQATTKFKREQPIVNTVVSPKGRINIPLSCTIPPEDMEILNNLAVFAVNKERRPIHMSKIVRALIKCGERHKNDLDFK